MPRLSDYVQAAATEYLQETGNIELDATWAAGFFQDSGLLEELPRQDMVAFYNLVQKELNLRADRAGKQACMKLAKIRWLPKPPRGE